MMKHYSLLALLSICWIGISQAVWEDDWITFYDDTPDAARLSIDKKVLFGNATTYTLTIQTLPPGVDRLSVAVVLDAEAEGSKNKAFQFTLNTAGSSEDSVPIVSKARGIKYRDIEDDPAYGGISRNEYAKYLALGEFEGKTLLTQEGVDILDVDGSYTNRDPEASSQFSFSFKIWEHAPLGANKVWVHWIAYDSATRGSANCSENCFNYEAVQGPLGPWEYLNLLGFGDFYNLDTIMLFYWMITGFSALWVIGLPVQISLGYALWGYMLFMDVKNFMLSFQVWNRSVDQSVRLGPWAWFLESFLFWDVGTYLTTQLMIVAGFIPVVGPLVNVIITLSMYLIAHG